MVRPPTLCVSKVTVDNERYTGILMGTVQYATAMGVLDSVRSGDIPREKVDEIGIIVSLWLNPVVATLDNLDHRILFDLHRKATVQAIHKAMNFKPSIDWLLENQEKIIHKYFEKGDSKAKSERTDQLHICWVDYLSCKTLASQARSASTRFAIAS